MVAVSAFAADKKKTPSPFLHVPFDVTKENLGAKFSGHSVFEIHQAVARNPPPVKGEFDKTDAIESALSAWKGRALYGSVTPSSLLAIPILDRLSFAGLEYDADAEEMKLTIHQTLCGDATAIRIFWRYTPRGSYIGSNTFGRKVRVQTGDALGACVDVGGSILDSWSYSFKVDHAVAKEIKHRGLIFLVGKLRPPYAPVERYASKPTIDSPVATSSTDYLISLAMEQILVVNSSTGDVVMRREVSPISRADQN